MQTVRAAPAAQRPCADAVLSLTKLLHGRRLLVEPNLGGERMCRNRLARTRESADSGHGGVRHDLPCLL